MQGYEMSNAADLDIPHRIGRWAKSLGPGLITGAADDDPSGIATYSITGASTGLSMLWTALITTPMMAVLDGTCSRIGLVTGKGLMWSLARSMPRALAFALAILVGLANTFNIGADIDAMAGSAHLLAPLPFNVWLIIFAVVPCAIGLYCHCVHRPSALAGGPLQFDRSAFRVESQLVDNAHRRARHDDYSVPILLANVDDRRGAAGTRTRGPFG
jgi:hypothetical protein